MNALWEGVEAISWGSPHWRLPSLIVGVLSVVAIVSAYLLVRGPQRIRWTAAMLKAAAIATLLICLVEPMRTEERPRPGANLFVVLTCNQHFIKA